jgi:hypothetical protein
MADLQSLGYLANAASAAAVIVAIVFGVVQLRGERKRRESQAAVEVVRTLLTDEIMGAHFAVFNLPDGMRQAQLETLDRETQDNVRRALFFYENLGVLVHRRVVRLDIVQDLLDLQIPWQKLRPWVEERRELRHNPHSWAWFQWLAEQMGDQTQGVPAHVAHRAWKP